MVVNAAYILVAVLIGIAIGRRTTKK